MTQSELIELFDRRGGELFWKRKSSKYAAIILGENAGCLHLDGYWKIGIGRKVYGRGRIIFMMIHGRWPAPELDHIDRNPLNDHPDNLRECTRSQNLVNRIMRPGKTGVEVRQNNRYRAKIRVNGRYVNLGTYGSFEEASDVFKAKQKELHGEFVPTN